MSDTGAFPGRTVFRKAFPIILSLVLLIALDQWTKALAVAWLKDGEPFVLLPGIFELRYVENTGAAFGILKGRSGVFFVMATVACIALSYALMRLPSGRRMLPLRACFVCIMAGAIGNLIDRLRLGYVVDFLYFRLIDFPVFNVADIYITCSCVILAFLFIFYYKDGDLRFL